MDLFVINRFRDDNGDNDNADQESKRLEKLKKDIEERKKSNITKDVISDEKPKSDQKSEDKLELKEVSIESKNVSNIEVKLKPKVSESTVHDFKILGGSEFEKKPKVQRILPYWLSHPNCISRNLQSHSYPLEEQNWLDNNIKSILLSDGISHLFPVQAEVIPFILKEHASPNCLWPCDVCVSAPTGSGKTLSFVIPIIQVLMTETVHYARALVVLPVQELATQIAKVFKKYCVRTGLKVALLSSSTPLHQEQQQIVRYTESLGWVTEVDIIVCTAGRLVEHIQNTEGFSLKHLKFLVIDEADRIMDHIQNDWLYHMDRHIKLENELLTGKVPSLNWQTVGQQKPPPHKLLFSATLSQDPEKLEQWGLFQPKLFSSAPVNALEDGDHIRKYTTPDELIEKYISCSAENKPLALYHFLVQQKWDKVLCFTNSAQTAHRLTVLLTAWGKDKIKVAELSAAVDRAARENVLKKFTNNEINVLIGTDALARGIDIPDCNYVISYDPPRNIKTYIHRVGRTSRAGRTGHAVTVLLPNQLNSFMAVIETGGKSKIPELNIQQEVYDNLLESYQSAIQESKNIIQSETSSKVKKSIEVKRGFKFLKRKREV